MLIRRSRGASMTADDTRAVEAPTRRRLLITVAAVVAAFGIGTLAFRRRGVAWLLKIALAPAGVAIFGYLVAQAIDAMAGEVTANARKEKRRRRMIARLEDHFII